MGIYVIHIINEKEIKTPEEIEDEIVIFPRYNS